MYHGNLKENTLLLLCINYEKISLHDILLVENAALSKSGFLQECLGLMTF